MTYLQRKLSTIVNLLRFTRDFDVGEVRCLEALSQSAGVTGRSWLQPPSPPAHTPRGSSKRSALAMAGSYTSEQIDTATGSDGVPLSFSLLISWTNVVVLCGGSHTIQPSICMLQCSFDAIQCQSAVIRSYCLAALCTPSATQQCRAGIVTHHPLNDCYDDTGGKGFI